MVMRENLVSVDTLKNSAVDSVATTTLVEVDTTETAIPTAQATHSKTVAISTQAQCYLAVVKVVIILMVKITSLKLKNNQFFN